MARGMSSGTTVAANAPAPNPADELQLTEQQIAELREAFGLFDKVLPRPAFDPNGTPLSTRAVPAPALKAPSSSSCHHPVIMEPP